FTVVSLAYAMYVSAAAQWTDQPASSKQFNIRVFLSAYSSIVNSLIFTRNRNTLFSTMEWVADLADCTYRLADNKGKVAMQQSALQSRLYTKLFLSYGATVYVAVGTGLLLEHRHYSDILDMTIGGAGDPGSTWRQVVGAIGYIQMPIFEYNAYIGCIGLFLTISLVSTVTRSLITVQGQINRGVERGDCVPWTALQSQVVRAARGSEEAFADVLPHILLSAYILPLLATADVVFNGPEADLFALAISPVVLVVLWPLCDLGDGLLEAREQLCTSAYSGPWLEETPSQTRRRLLMMSFSYGRRGLLRTRGLGGGVLSREAFGDGLINWVKFLNGIINLKTLSKD
ncbi:Odorant receptor 81, partial [Frankliniella occidentalis]